MEQENGFMRSMMASFLAGLLAAGFLFASRQALKPSRRRPRGLRK